MNPDDFEIALILGWIGLALFTIWWQDKRIQELETELEQFSLTKGL